MINYPNSTKKFSKSKQKQISSNKVAFSFTSANRGMDLEADIIESNKFYLDTNQALIYKRPTPIGIVKVDYQNGARIKDAFFQEKTTTDFNGVFQGRYVDIEAKSTKNKTSFPLSNITKHQIEHLKRVIQHDGLAFFIVEFTHHEKTFILKAQSIIDWMENEQRKSIPYDKFFELGREIKRGYLPRLDYLEYIREINSIL